MTKRKFDEFVSGVILNTCYKRSCQYDVIDLLAIELKTIRMDLHRAWNEKKALQDEVKNLKYRLAIMSNSQYYNNSHLGIVF